MTEQICEKNVSDTLANLGYSFDFHVADYGGWNKSAHFSITLKKNGNSFTFDYFNNARIWHKTWGAASLAANSGFAKFFKSGKEVGQLPKLKKIEDCYPEQQPFQRKAFETFAELTSPVIPTLADVMYCIWNDCSGVRHGQTFEQFCDEFDYDSDSRKAEKIYNTCVQNWQGMIRLNADFEKLNEIFQNY